MTRRHKHVMIDQVPVLGSFCRGCQHLGPSNQGLTSRLLAPINHSGCDHLKTINNIQSIYINSFVRPSISLCIYTAFMRHCGNGDLQNSVPSLHKRALKDCGQ